MSYTLSLDETERQILIILLESAIDDLHSEITHSAGHDYKEMLKSRRQALQKILGSLQATEQGPAG